ncbi:MAG: insulinase family protein [Massilibacteroides sp.]|nr:insulinase family protein [Massilibacteroides sp.]MDD3062242.1 insulinase family protein [Massilibacteroides sp.]MDD4114019.1 insulinase family protein [Massilibacteroides sp.]MDD4660015.1 insulinase family protein [Massilibacteroides sp.]
MKRENLFPLWIAFLLVSVGLQAQQAPLLPIDPKVRYGQLENGLTYYIRGNQEPKKRAEFFIAQNVGAILENDDQNGLAHFLEHMAFNGTKNFPGKGIINYLESIGVRFGYEINAYTSLDETVYNLSSVPTMREGVVDSALLVLHDWSNFILLEGDEIDSERGVIMEEWRTGQGPERRMWEKTNALKYAGSQYAKRDVIGDTAVIKNFSHQAIRDFYHKWYRPDLQAIVVVGDIDVDQIENKIKTLFSDIPRMPNAGERPVYELPENDEPIIAMVTDPEARYATIRLEYKKNLLPENVKTSVAGYAFYVANDLISTMINNRFSEITQQADAPFVAGYAYYGNIVKSKDAFILIGVPKESKEQEGLDALVLEAEKIKRFGFTNSEFERAKTDLLKSVEKQYNDRDHQKSSQYVREYVRHFLDKEPIPGIEWEFQTLQMMLPQLKVVMVNQMVQSYITDKNLIISINAPEKESVKLPNNAGILAAFDKAAKAELTAKAEEDLNKPLLKETPDSGTIVKESENKALGVTEWTLSNGVKVILKPTAFKKDEILMSAFSQGGTSKVDNVDDLLSATFADHIVSNNGLGDFSQIDLQKALTGKIVDVNPYISEFEEGFSGSSSVADFETMLQLVYLNFTGVRKDDNSYQAFINMLNTSLANAAKDPRQAFSDSINQTLTAHHPRTISLKLESVSKIDQEKALAIFKDRFAIPADFIFVFVGNVSPENSAFRQAVCTYLGGLPSEHISEKYTDHQVRAPKGIVKNYFMQEMEVKKASNLIYYTGSLPYNLQNKVTIKAIENLLFDRYLDSIREKEGGSYGVSVRAALDNTPIEQAILILQFDTDPEKQARLMDIIHQEVDNLSTNGPSIEAVKKIQENMLKKYDENQRENGWWRSTIKAYYEDGIDYVKEYKNAVNALTPALIKDMLKKLVGQKNVIEVVMTPAD